MVNEVSASMAFTFLRLLLMLLPVSEVTGDMPMPMDLGCKQLRGYAGCACRMTDSNLVIGLQAVLGNLTDSLYPRLGLYSTMV